MQIDVKEYSFWLKKLWADTFGDSEEYIDLLLNNGYTPSECFAEINDGEVVSVLYLLKGYIVSDGKSYEGRYLYAAATAKRCRGKGIMAKLIKEAQSFVKEKGLSFICLVPADEGLYGYYARFGFEAVMKNYISEAVGERHSALSDELDVQEYLCTRKDLPLPYFSFGEAEWKYALSCLDYAGFTVMKNTDDSFCIINDEKNEIVEYISSQKNLKKNTEELLKKINSEAVITSPYDLSGVCMCKENKFGMIYFSDILLKECVNDCVYMNIALD